MPNHNLAVPPRGFDYGDECDDDEPDDETQGFAGALERREAAKRAELERQRWPDGRPEATRYRGGPTAEEQRYAWQRTHRHGASARASAPGLCALYWAWRELEADEAAAERFKAAGLFPELRDSVFGDLDPEVVEAVLAKAQGRIFDRDLTARLMRARLPEMVYGAEGPAQIGQVSRDLARVPDWVWNAGRKPVGPVRGELDEA